MTTPEQRHDAAAEYGWSLAVINSDPELKKLFKQATGDPPWSAARFAAEAQDTKWFKKHSANWRTDSYLAITDPKTWAEQHAAAVASVRDIAASMGAVIPDKQLSRIAGNINAFGWNASQQRDVLAHYVNVAASGPLKGQYLGDAGKNAAALEAIALRNGYRIPKGSLQNWNRDILAGNSTVENYSQFIRRQAAAAFPTFAEELHAGADLEDLASPYKASMSQILEIPPAQVTLFDPKIRKALASKDVKTGKPVAMPIYDFEDSLRKDARWAYTDNAHQEILGQGRSVARMMGLGT